MAATYMDTGLYGPLNRKRDGGWQRSYKGRHFREVQHPEYQSLILDWRRWRLTYEGGRLFIHEYLEKFARENPTEFERRRKITYNPAFAKAAVNEIRNALFQRMVDIKRIGGSKTYRDAVEGKLGGVDLKHVNLLSFFGRKVIPELLTMAKVGVWIDNESLPSAATLADLGNKHPYFYVYRAEDIRSWTYLEGPRQGEFGSILLADTTYTLNDLTQLPTTKVENFRHVFIDPADGLVHVQTQGWDYRDGPLDEVILEMTKIPFVLFEMEHSLLKDVDQYQVAMLNMASADVSYATKSNFPFYIEQHDSRTNSPHVRPSQKQDIVTKDPTTGLKTVTPAGQANEATQAKFDEVRIGAASGRRYPKDVNAPAFIHPSPEPLRVSMEKQAQMKEEIRELVHLAVSALQASAESKSKDSVALENGLSHIGLILEQGDRQMAEIWGLYEHSPPAQVYYPVEWSTQTDEDRRKDAKELADLIEVIPSSTYQKEVAKQVACKLIGHRVDRDTLQAIYDEIDRAKAITADSKRIGADLEAGIVSAATASEIRGYPKGEADKAKEEHAERVAMIAASQAPATGDPGARGVKDLSSDPKSGQKERENDQNKRGEGKFDPKTPKDRLDDKKKDDEAKK